MVASGSRIQVVPQVVVESQQEVRVRATPHSAVARTFAAALSIALVLASVVPAGAAPPTNAAIEQKRAQAEAASQKLDELNTDLELRYEELGQIEDAVQKTRAQITAAEADLDQATNDVQRSEALLNRRATSIYRNGAVDILAVFVGATDFQDFISRLDLMRRIGRSDASLVASVKDARGRVVSAKQALETRQTEQIALRDQARIKQGQVQRALEAQKAYLGSINAELKKLIEAERIRQEKLAAERAARLAAAQRAAAASSQARILPFDPAKLGAPHPEAVEIAKEYLGVPYVWGGTTPGGFDCSGLMVYVYAKLGIELPRTSRSQFRVGGYIPPNRLDLLQPGDLVFFGLNGNPDLIHHVGMYVGSDEFIHAPASGDIVRITSLSGRISSKGDYVGAIRP
jgi:peptidoglycan DL-endopeptidase CwlO